MIVAGESWLRGKGIGHDCDDAAAYDAMLATLPFNQRLDAETTKRAEAYAYHFFFRRMIPLPGLDRARLQGAPYEISITGLEMLEPHGNAALDSVCDGIFTGMPFVIEGPER